MCRMIASLSGVLGDEVIAPFSRMAQGMNAFHELNQSLGKFAHPDGWGAVYKEDDKLRVYHNIARFWSDPNTEVLHGTKVYLLHARRASRGATALNNVHPFSMIRAGETWYFCHNGTIDDPVIEKYPYDSDSARYFHYLLDRFDARDPEGSLSRAVAKITEYTAVNAFLFTAGRLCVINRYKKYPRYYTMYRAGPLFSSEPLFELASDWAPLENGTIICLEQ